MTLLWLWWIWMVKHVKLPSLVKLFPTRLCPSGHSMTLAPPIVGNATSSNTSLQRALALKRQETSSISYTKTPQDDYKFTNNSKKGCFSAHRESWVSPGSPRGKVNTSLPGLISSKDLCKSTCTTSGNAQPQKFKRTRSSARDRSSLLRDPRFVNELQYATFNSKSEMVICSKGFTRFSREVNAVWDKRKWRILSDCMSSDNTWMSDKCWQPVTSSFKVCRDVILGRQLPPGDGEDGEAMVLPPKCFSSHPEKSRSKTSGRNKNEIRKGELWNIHQMNLQYFEIIMIHDVSAAKSAKSQKLFIFISKAK